MMSGQMPASKMRMAKATNTPACTSLGSCSLRSSASRPCTLLFLVCGCSETAVLRPILAVFRSPLISIHQDVVMPPPRKLCHISVPPAHRQEWM